MVYRRNRKWHKEDPRSDWECFGRIAAEVVHNHNLFDRLVPIFVGHYETGARGTKDDPQTFDLVTFRGGHRAGTPGEPHWLALYRQTVEELVGQEVR